MKRKYIHTVKNPEPMTVYKARCKFDVDQALGDKKTVYCSKLKSGEWVTYYSK